MNKISRYMQNYLLYGFPFVITLIIWFKLSPNASTNFFIKNLHELLSFNLMFWFLTLVLYMVLLVVVPSVRDKTLKRLANLQERDEREEYITGKAARASYIATLSLMLFLLFFSLFKFNFSEKQQTGSNMPKHSVSIGIHYSSNSTLILILLGWQLLIFNLAARREGLKG